MAWWGIVGIVGALMQLLKIGIHIYIKSSIDRKFDIGPSGNMLNPELFLPIFDDVEGGMKVVKKVGNALFVVSSILLLVFLIAVITHPDQPAAE